MFDKYTVSNKYITESDLSPHVLVSNTCILDGKWVKIKNIGIYYAKGVNMDEDNLICLNKTQRNFLQVINDEEISVDIVNIDNLPSIFLNVMVTNTKHVPVDISKEDLNEFFKKYSIINPAEKITATIKKINYFIRTDAINICKIGNYTVNNYDKTISKKLSDINISEIAEQDMTPIINKFQTMNFKELGVGGVSDQFDIIFRRIFLPRMLKNEQKKLYGIVEEKGIILYGPPGTGKTRLARSLAKNLGISDKKVRVINGPELLNKYVGKSEENVRNLFEEPRNDPNNLYVFIFDEFDSIARKRGGDGCNSKDLIINQLLTMVDGYDKMNNIIMFGLTNRIELLDDAILRPGRFGIHIYIGLPDIIGREEILIIHSKELLENGHLDGELLKEVAKITTNFTGAELEALVKSTINILLRKHIDITNLDESIKNIPKNLNIQLHDFHVALGDIKPSFGAETFNLPEMTKCISQYDKIMNILKEKNIVCITGNRRTGKTTLSKRVLNNIDVDYKKYICGRDYISQTDKKEFLIKTFHNAPSDSSIEGGELNNGLIVIDNIEILLDIASGNFNNSILQVLLMVLNEFKFSVIMISNNIDMLIQLKIVDETTNIIEC